MALDLVTLDISYSAADVDAALAKHRARLEAMFNEPRLGRLRTKQALHPAVAEWAVFHTLARELRHPLPSHEHEAIAVLRATLDAMPWAPDPPTSDFWSFLDEASRRHVMARLRDEKSYPDVIAELFMWGWLKNERGLAAERVERPGLADLVIDQGTPREVRGDVKRIHRSTTPGAVGRHVKKANDQIKKSQPPGGGIAFLSLDLPVRYVDAEASHDHVSELVQPFIDVARNAISRDNRSVSAVTLTWDEIRVGRRDRTAWVLVRRRSRVLRHPDPLVPLALADEDVRPTMLASVQLEFPPPDVINQDPGELLRVLRETTNRWRRVDATAIRRSQHVRGDMPGVITLQDEQVHATFRDPDGLAVHDVPGSFTLATKRVTSAHDDHVLVLTAGWLPADRVWLVSGAFRLYADRFNDLDALQRDPNLAFATVLGRFGIRFSVAGGRAYWLPEVRIAVPFSFNADDPNQVGPVVVEALGTSGPDHASFLTLSCARVGHELVLGGLYQIDADRYRATLLAADRRRDRSRRKAAA